MSMSKEPWTNLHGLIEEVLRAEYRIEDSGIRILLARDWFVRAAALIRKARGERYCHSEYGSANCKWEPGIGCTPKCPECIP